MNDRVLENIELAYHAAMTTRWMWVDPEQDMEEAKAAAVMGLVEGDRRFDPEKHKKGEDGWSQYVWMWARAYAQQTMTVNRAPVTRRENGKLRGLPSPTGAELEAPMEGGWEPRLNADAFDMGAYTPDEGGSIIDRLHNETMLARVLEIVARLPEKQRIVIEYRHGLNGKPVLVQREIAEIIGVKKQNGASYHYMAGIRAIREELGVAA